MSVSIIQFSRRYRAALLDYLLGSGESGLARAYDLGRRAIDQGLGPVQVLRSHHRALAAVLQSSCIPGDSLRTLKAADEFLMESVSPFEMTHRGYIDLLATTRQPRDPGSDSVPRATSRDTAPAELPIR